MIMRVIIAAALAGGLAVANAEPGPGNGDIVNVDARYVFAPEGFDDNDESIVMLDGYLPSGCYKLTRPMVEIDERTKQVNIKPMARYFNVPCIEALIPYQYEIKLGILSEGLYTINVNSAAVESLDVAEATSAGPDDYLYAPIDQASVEKTDAGLMEATIEGRFTNSCMVWDEVKVQDNGKTVNILPIMKVDGTNCVAGEFPFKKTVQLPDSVSNGRHLLHVRSLNGNAVNHLFFKSPY